MELDDNAVSILLYFVVGLFNMKNNWKGRCECDVIFLYVVEILLGDFELECGAL